MFVVLPAAGFVVIWYSSEGELSSASGHRGSMSASAWDGEVGVEKCVNSSAA